MRDANQEDEQGPANPPAGGAGEPEYPVDRLRRRLNDSLGERPLTVYLVLFAGAATLLVLLIIVWVSATGGGGEDRPICTATTAGEARDLILGGRVERVRILVDQDDPLQSLTGIELELDDDTCRQSPQGADIRDDLLMLVGAVDLYNEFAEERVRVGYQRQEVQTELLVTSTPTPPPTVPPTPPPASPTAPPPPADTPTPPATATTPPQPTATARSTATAAAAATAPVTPTAGP